MYTEFDGAASIKGIGVDSTTISRFKNMPQETFERLMKRILCEEELTFLQENKNAYKIAAVYFSSKEAVSKSLGTGMRGIAFCDIMIKKNTCGRSLVFLSPRARKIAEDACISGIKLSVTHEGDVVTAVAVAG